MPRKAISKPAPNQAPAGPSQALASRLGHTFRQPSLLTLALTHRSFVFDSSAPAAGSTDAATRSDPSLDNEQFEFLGDAVLGLLVAEALCLRFPASREGELTRLRASLVSRRNLGEVGLRLDLGRSLRLGRTTEENGGRANPSLASNAVEAVIAALYLDGGLEAARGFVEREILASLDHSAPGSPPPASLDHKTTLQELVQSSGLGRPRYLPLAESGPDHRRLFRVGLSLEGNGADLGQLAEAEGPTKKAGAAGSRPPRSRHPPPARHRCPRRSPPTRMSDLQTLPQAEAQPETQSPPLPPAPELLRHPHGFLPAVQSLLYLIIVALFIFTFTLQPIRIPSSSMEPTLLIGDFLLLDRQAVSTDRDPLMPPTGIHRGDVVVFHDPVQDPSIHLVKRVIGLPGDRLHLRGNQVFINGRPLPETYARYAPSLPDGYRDNFPSLAAMDARVDSAWWIRLRSLIHDNEITVPEGSYFVLGDNRNNSDDSRYWGFVPRRYIVGKPLLVYFSWNEDADRPHPSATNPNHPFARWNRLFHVLH